MADAHAKPQHDYHIIDTWEAGVVLTGSEVKSAREGHVQLGQAYAEIRDGEVLRRTTTGPLTCWSLPPAIIGTLLRPF